MKLLLRSLVVLLLTQTSIAQVTLFQEDFENSNAFAFSGDLVPNKWIQGICAGNGASLPGDTSIYVSQSGLDAGCGATGEDQYTFTNSPAGTLSLIASTTIDGTCATSIEVAFDYQVSSSTGDYFSELVYSTDGGSSWVPVGSPLANTTGWTSTTVSLPALLDGTSFELGFRYTYNTTVITGDPLAIDNIEVTGVDNIQPVLSCVGAITQNTGINCSITLGDIKDYIISLTDNCSAEEDIALSMTPAPATVIPGSVGDIVPVEITATDEAGNPTTCNFTIEYIDAQAPTFTYCPTDTTIYLDNSCSIVLGDMASGVVAVDNCSSSLNYDQSVAASTVYSAETNFNITIDVLDASLNLAQCTFNVIVEDSIVPTIVCPSDQNEFANSNCEFLLPDYTSIAIINDNCVSNGAMTVNQSPAPGLFANDGELITLTVTGGDPSVPQTCTFTINLSDTTSPSIVCPSITNQYVDDNCDFVLQDYTGGIAWTDNCESSLSNMTVIQSPAAGVSVNTNTSVTITIEDPSGNSNQCTMNIIVLDTIKPQITCPVDQDVNVNSSCFAVMPDYSGSAVVLDNCSSTGAITVTQSPLASTTFNVPTVVTLSAEDEAGNIETCSFTVTPIDAELPSISCPGNTTVSTNSGCNYTLTDWTSSAVVSDNCTSAGNLIIGQSPIIGSNLGLGTHTLQLTVEDESGNINQCSFDLTVEDQVAPTFDVCPSLQTEYADNNCDATLADYTSLASVLDNCSSLISITQSPIAGTVINGSQVITLTATDENNNQATCNFTVVASDTTSPIVTCPSDFDIAIDANCDYLIPDLVSQVTGTDNCSDFANMTVSQNPASGSTENGSTAVLITLNDEAGNSSTCITSITPIDNVAPIITCPSNSIINNGFNCDYTLPYYGTSAPVNDNCDNYIITQSPLQGTVVQPGTHVIELTVTDAGGNTDVCSFSITVEEYEAPTISCPQNSSTCNPVVNYLDPTFSDNCFAYIEQTDNTGLTSGDTFPVGTTVLEYTVMDSTGNSNSCSFFIEVLDYPSQATILEDTLALCGQTSALLEAEVNTSGTGEWVLVTGQGNFGNEFANVTGLNNLDNGETIVVWTVSSISCGSTSDTLVIINSASPSNANVQDTLIACGLEQVSLNTATPSSGSGMWSSPQASTIINANSPNAVATDIPNGWNQFVWTISSPGCPSNSDTMNVLYSGNVTIANADTSMCFEEQSPLTIFGSGISSDQTASWSFNQGFGIISDPNEIVTDIHSLDIGVNKLVYTVSHPQCPNDSDTITVIITLCDGFDPVFPTLITPNYDGDNDVFEIQHLQNLYPECKVTIFNRWGSVVYESIGYETPWDGRYNGEDLPMGTYFYKIELNDDENKVYTGPISIIH